MREAGDASITVDEALLDRLIEVTKRAAARHGLPMPSINSLLLVRGIVDAAEARETEEEREAAHAAFTAGFARALDAVAAARVEEGQA